MDGDARLEALPVSDPEYCTNVLFMHYIVVYYLRLFSHGIPICALILSL